MPEPEAPDPSAPLKNRRHENFSVDVSLGETNPTNCYLRHFETENQDNAKKAAYRLLKRPEVAARIDHLRRERVNRRIRQVVLSNEWVIEELIRQYYLCDAEGDRKSAAQFLKMIAIEQGMLVTRREVIHGKMDQLEGTWEEINARIASRIARLFPGRRPDEILALLRATRAGRGADSGGAAAVPPVRPLPETVDVSPSGSEPPRALPDGREPGGQDVRSGDGDSVPHDRALP
jgi:hypothetical protein